MGKNLKVKLSKINRFPEAKIEINNSSLFLLKIDTKTELDSCFDNHKDFISLVMDFFNINRHNKEYCAELIINWKERLSPFFFPY